MAKKWGISQISRSGSRRLGETIKKRCYCAPLKCDMCKRQRGKKSRRWR